ncbi:phosphatase [Spirochaetia bacterium]|nr:phosphatase [Spirochaetia bacterium]
MIDLHTHSTASDGKLTPAALMQAAHTAGITTIALTDHDTIDGIPEAQDEAEKLKLKLIPGVEIEIDWNGNSDYPLPKSREFHLLGLNIKNPSAGFIELMKELKILREERNKKIIKKMNDEGLNADYEELRSMTSGGCIGRPHFAQYLIKLGMAKNVEQAFDRYLSKGKPFYYQKPGADFKRALYLIKESGGIAVLAHPTTLYVSWGKLPDILKTLADEGLEGIEAWHPLATAHTCERLEKLGVSLGLRITAGSDYHGGFRMDRKLGCTGGGRKIDDRFLDAFL